MERRHAYWLDCYGHEATEEALFDMCETFMNTPECSTLENDVWKIMGGANDVISVVNKETTRYHTVNVDIDKIQEELWMEVAEADRIHEENVTRINNRIFKVLISMKGEQFVEDLKYLIEEDEIQGAFEIVNKPKGSCQKENEYGMITEIWVHQWLNGGMEGDSFAGDIYIEIKKGKFLKMYYSC